jgi:hypothetical protein
VRETANPRPELICTGCNKHPSELAEYLDMAEVEDMTPDDYVWQEDGTLNRANGRFLCTDCYMDAGMPSSPTGWVAL